MAKDTKMTQEAKKRIQGAADRNKDSKTAQDGFKERAQRAADKKESK